MLLNTVLLLFGFLLILFLLAKPLGELLAGLIENRPLPGTSRLESMIWRSCGIRTEEMNWLQYVFAILLFNILGLLLLFILLITQAYLPLNPQHLPNLSWDLALNTAVSFITNTNWQSYSGENTLSYFSQMAGLTVQNFLSAATGIAVIFVLCRALAGHTVQKLGNAWIDLTRITLCVLLPLALLIALFFVSQGVLQNFQPYLTITTLEGAQQTLPMGPVASQESIKLLGTNGGGFFGANSAHPFENPTVWSNFVQLLAIFLIPCALCFAFGKVVGDHRQGYALILAMTLLFILAAIAIVPAEQAGNPLLAQLGADTQANMEGKEGRFGILLSSLYAVVTTATSCGAVNTMHDSLTPLGGMIPMWLMQIGEVVFGGVGSGLYGMLMFVLLTVFIAGLMIGRTPEYLGKKIETYEMKMVAIAILITPTLVLVGTALAIAIPAGLSGIANPGAHGFSEILYAYSSAANNNGSAFGGLNSNTLFYNLTLAVAMLLGRFGVIIPVMAIAGSMGMKKRQRVGEGSLPTHGLLFVGMLIGTVLLVGALTFVPALALGPIVEYLTVWQIR